MLPLDIPTYKILKLQMLLRATEFWIFDEALSSFIASRNSTKTTNSIIETTFPLILDSFFHKLRSVTVPKIHKYGWIVDVFRIFIQSFQGKVLQFENQSPNSVSLGDIFTRWQLFPLLNSKMCSLFLLPRIFRQQF